MWARAQRWSALGAGAFMVASPWYFLHRSDRAHDAHGFHKLSACLAVDALLRNPSVARGQETLQADPYGVPRDHASRVAVQDLADVVYTAAVGSVLMGKSAYLAELLVANPFMQDHMLQDSKKWAPFVALAKDAVQGGAMSEAVRFLNAYEEEAQKCARHTAVMSTPGGSTLFCGYSQAVYLRHGGALA